MDKSGIREVENHERAKLLALAWRAGISHCDKAAVNVATQTSVEVPAFSSLGHISINGIAGSYTSVVKLKAVIKLKDSVSLTPTGPPS